MKGRAWPWGWGCTAVAVVATMAASIGFWSTITLLAVAVLLGAPLLGLRAWFTCFAVAVVVLAVVALSGSGCAGDETRDTGHTTVLGVVPSDLRGPSPVT